MPTSARPKAHRPRRPAAVLVLVVVLVVVGLVIAARGGTGAGTVGTGMAALLGGASASSGASPDTQDLAATGSAVDTRLARAVAGLAPDISVGVTDLTTGTAALYTGNQSAFDTASIVKVAILATLLLDCQDQGRQLTGTESAEATTMIENSDDPAATTLWNEVGAASGMAAGLARLGLTHTVPGANGYWGLTTTTAADQITMMADLTSAASPLSALSRSYILTLMRNVEADQDWGVTAPADSGTSPAVKVGWFQHSATGLWVVNSVGVITYDGHTALLAVLTDNQSSLAAGEQLANTAATAAARAVIGS